VPEYDLHTERVRRPKFEYVSFAASNKNVNYVTLTSIYALYEEE